MNFRNWNTRQEALNHIADLENSGWYVIGLIDHQDHWEVIYEAKS